jgi:hypothetical protein
MRRNTGRRRARYTVALVGDGFTESIYFSDLRDTLRPERLHIAPEFPGRFGSYAGVLDRAIELTENYSRVYAMIDMDAVIAQQQTAAYLQHKGNAERQGVIVLENNPCFEIWLLLHFIRTGRLFQNCGQVVSALRRHMPGYSKNLKYAEAARLFASLHDRLPQAIENAGILEENRDEHDALYPRAEVFRFFEWFRDQ